MSWFFHFYSAIFSFWFFRIFSFSMQICGNGEMVRDMAIGFVFVKRLHSIRCFFLSFYSLPSSPFRSFAKMPSHGKYVFHRWNEWLHILVSVWFFLLRRFFIFSICYNNEIDARKGLKGHTRSVILIVPICVHEKCLRHTIVFIIAFYTRTHTHTYTSFLKMYSH